MDHQKIASMSQLTIGAYIIGTKYYRVNILYICITVGLNRYLNNNVYVFLFKNLDRLFIYSF